MYQYITLFFFFTIFSFANENTFEKVANNVFVMHGTTKFPKKINKGFVNNPAFIESKKSLIVIDPGISYKVGLEVLKKINKLSTKPIVAIFNTHNHPDHWFANKAIVQKYPHVKIYSSTKMIKTDIFVITNLWYDYFKNLHLDMQGTKPFAFPKIGLNDNDYIKIDQEIFKITHPEKAHSRSDILIKHINSSTMFLGDNVMLNRLGNFGKDSSILGNIKLLEKIQDKKDTTVYVPGHGRTDSYSTTIVPYLNYLYILKNNVIQACADNIELENFEKVGIYTKIIKKLQKRFYFPIEKRVIKKQVLNIYQDASDCH